MLSENHQHLSNLSRNGSGSSGETWNFHLSRNFPRKCSTHLMLLSTETWLWQIGKYPLLRSQWKGNRHQTKCSPAIQVSRSTQRCFMFYLKYLIKCNITISSNNNIQIIYLILSPTVIEATYVMSMLLRIFAVLFPCRINKLSEMEKYFTMDGEETEYLCQVRPVTSNSSGAVQWSGFDITTIGSQSQDLTKINDLPA